MTDQASLCLLNVAYREKPGWRARGILPFDPHAVAETKTLICVKETRKKVGQYADGASAYRLYWSVRLVSVPDGEVLGRESFYGSDPPKIKKSTESGTPSGLGVLEWLTSRPGNDPILNVGKCRGIAYSPRGEALALGCAEIPPAVWNVVTRRFDMLPSATLRFATVHFLPSNQVVITNCPNIRMSRMVFYQFWRNSCHSSICDIRDEKVYGSEPFAKVPQPERIH